jgi:antitoxin HigA-1
MAGFPPVHPGEILRTEFLEPLGISTYRLAKAIDVPQTRLSEILRGRRRSPPTRRCVCPRHWG